ncbi:MAG: hypothetical protein IJ237_02190 [Oscillospiraceae bacterium]|nr:hypothetical protein [Oscillospiraceae bacterium]
MNRKTNAFWAALTILIVLAALVLCFMGQIRGILFARPSGNPQSAVTGFFDALKAGSYDTACSYLENYSSLGLDQMPASEEGQLMLSALKRSYDYSLSGNLVLLGTKASQKVLLRYLDLDALHEAAMARTDLDYSSALREILSNPDSCCTSDFYDVTINYTDGKWLMVLDNDLLTALQGGRG